MCKKSTCIFYGKMYSLELLSKLRELEEKTGVPFNDGITRMKISWDPTDIVQKLQHIQATEGQVH